MLERVTFINTYYVVLRSRTLFTFIFLSTRVEMHQPAKKNRVDIENGVLEIGNCTQIVFKIIRFELKSYQTLKEFRLRRAENNVSRKLRCGGRK